MYDSKLSWTVLQKGEKRNEEKKKQALKTERKTHKN